MYGDAKPVVKHSVRLAKFEAEKEEFTTVSLDGDGVFCISKQMDCTNQDIVGERCVSIDAGELALTEGDKIKAGLNTMLRSSMFRLSGQAAMFLGSFQLLAPHPVWAQTGFAKRSARRNAAKLLAHLILASYSVAEMPKAAGEEGVELARQLTD